MMLLRKMIIIYVVTCLSEDC